MGRSMCSRASRMISLGPPGRFIRISPTMKQTIRGESRRKLAIPAVKHTDPSTRTVNSGPPRIFPMFRR